MRPAIIGLLSTSIRTQYREASVWKAFSDCSCMQYVPDDGDEDELNLNPRVVGPSLTAAPLPVYLSVDQRLGRAL